MLHLQNLLTRRYRRTQSTGPSNGKKPRPKATYGVDILPLPTTLGPGDFQKTILDEVSHVSNEGSHSIGMGDRSYPAAGNEIPAPPPMATKEAGKQVRNVTPKNHNTPTSLVEHYELNMELLFDILRSHCETGGGTNRTRFVTSLYATNLYADTEIQYPPKFHDLDIDILLEILRYYVAYQTDGVFILMLLSTAWSEFVLNSPTLWQWVTIDSLSPDWVEKAGCCHSLSAAYPLQIVLRLPMSDWSHVTPLLSKCGNLFIEVPDYIPSKDVEGMTGELLAAAGSTSCRIHWYRAGEELLTESREPFTVDLSHVTTLHLEADGSEHPQYHVYAQTHDTRYRERGDEYHPLVLLKPFHVLQVLRNAYYLRHLAISHHSMDPIFVDLDLPLVTMVYLQHLEIHDIDLTRNGVLSPLVQSLRCPALAILSLSGKLADIVATLQYCNEIGHPQSLSLRVEKHELPELQPLRPSILPSVVSLSLHVMFQGLENHQAQFLMRYLNVFTKTLRRLTRVNFISPRDWFEDTTPLQMLSSSGWRRFHSVLFEYLSNSTRCTVLNYIWDATQSSMTIESKTPHVFELLDILGETKKPYTLRLMLENDNTRVFRSLSSRPSVKTLHLQIGQCRNQLQTIQHIRSLLEAFPMVFEMYLNLHSTLSQWISPYSIISSDRPHKLRISATKARNGSNTISLLDHTLSTRPSVTIISGVSDVVTAFASVLSTLGDLLVTQVGILQHRNSSNQIHCLRIADADLKNRERRTYTGKGYSPALTLQCMGAYFDHEERFIVGKSTDQAATKLCQLTSIPRLPFPDNFVKVLLLDMPLTGTSAVLERVNIEIKRQNSVRSTTDYTADRNTTIMSIYGTGILVLQLLNIIRDQRCSPWNFRTGSPNASPVLLANASATCLRLRVGDNFDGTSILKYPGGIVEALPQLCELQFTIPPSWRTKISGSLGGSPDHHPSAVISGVTGIVLELTHIIKSYGNLAVSGEEFQVGDEVFVRFKCLRTPHVDNSESCTEIDPTNIPSVTSIFFSFSGSQPGLDERMCLSKDAHRTTTVTGRISGIRLRSPADWFGKATTFEILPPYMWKTAQKISIEFEYQDGFRSIVGYTMDRHQSTMSLSGSSVLISKLLEIIGDAENPANLELLFDAETLAPPQVFSSRPSVTCLRLQVEDNITSTTVVEEIKNLVETLPQLSEIQFSVPSIWWQKLSLPHIFTSIRLIGLQCLVVKAGKSISLEYSKLRDEVPFHQSNAHPTVAAISGSEYLSILMAQSLQMVDSLSIPHGEFENEEGEVGILPRPKYNHMCLRMTNSRARDTARSSESIRDFIESLDGSIRTCLVLPSPWGKVSRAAPSTEPCSLEDLCIEAFKAGSTVLYSSRIKKLKTPPASLDNMVSLLFSKFSDNLRPRVFERTHDGSYASTRTCPDSSIHGWVAFQLKVTDVGDNFGPSAIAFSSAASVLVSQFKPASMVRLQFPSHWSTRGLGVPMTCIHCSPTSGARDRIEQRKENMATPKCTTLRRLACQVYFHDSPTEHIDITMPCAGDPCTIDVVNGNFSVLTTVRCTPNVLLPFLSRTSVPTLHTVLLHFPISDSRPHVESELAYFDSKITTWLIEHKGFFPNLHTLGLSWFPCWSDLLHTLRSISGSQNHDDNFTLKLPGHPHKSIERAVKRAMHGNTHESDMSLPGRERYDNYMGVKAEDPGNSDIDSSRPHTPTEKACYYCVCSGLDCRQYHPTNRPHCARYSQTDLVSISKPTFVRINKEQT